MTDHSVWIRGVDCQLNPFDWIGTTQVWGEYKPMIPSVMRDIDSRQIDVFRVCVGNLHRESSVDRGRVKWMGCSKIESKSGVTVVSDFRGELLGAEAIHVELAFYPMNPAIQGFTRRPSFPFL